MALWCRSLPIVSVPRGETAKRVTLIYPFYDCPEFFARQVQGWCQYPADLRAHASMVVVDDGSPEPAVLPTQRQCSIRLFRIHEDRRWNWLAARNIGAHHAEDGWMLLTDMDHVVPADTLRAVVYGQHEPSAVYAFSRREHTGEAIAPHSASFLMTRAMFWKIGGYDERCSGLYGSDGLYRARVAKTAPMRVLTDHLERHEYQGDSSTTRYGRKEPQDAALRKLVSSFPKGSKPKTLSFAYHQVAP